jgi:hypothetical protein
MRAVYRLGNEFEPDDADLAIIIEALTVATKGKSKVISVAEADSAIDMTLLRIEHGDYPDATLTAINDLQKWQPWTVTATEALKAKRPTTSEAAEQITDAVHRAHIVSLYAFGGLPDDLPDDALWALEDVSEEDRAALLDKIKYLARPLTDEAIVDCVHDLARADIKTRESAEATKDAVDRAAERSVEETARQSTSKPQQLPGANSPAELERKLARLEELEPRVSMLERVKVALESENEELRAAKPVRPSLMEALEIALELAREAARHNGGLSSGKAKKREKALNDIRSSIALLMELEREAKPAQRAVTADQRAVRM